MNNNAVDFQEWSELDVDSEDISLNDLDILISEKIEEEKAELEQLEEDFRKIGTPESIGETIEDTIMEQLSITFGVDEGKQFIEENHSQNLDLRDSAHIQTTENFVEGNFATHNHEINYAARYDEYMANFKRDADGNIIYHPTRSGKMVETLVEGAREPYDKGRPTGSVERGTDMDHPISAAEIIRDPEAAVHTTLEERVGFANNPNHLNEMDAGQNRSKGDNSTTDWLDYPNSKGQKPQEIFDMSDEQVQQYREKDQEVREAYREFKEEGEKQSIELGRKSQVKEATKMAKHAGSAFLKALLADFLKEVIKQLVKWFKNGERKLSEFFDSFKQAFVSFWDKIKKEITNGLDTAGTAIATAIFGPIIGTLKKAWSFLKQGYRSIKDAIKFLRNPANKNMPFSIKMAEVGKIVIAGITAGATIALAGTIETGLTSIGLGVEIPLFGSLASILGVFLSALVCGIIGALALNLINKLIAKKLKKIKDTEIIDTGTKIIKLQEEGNEVKKEILKDTKEGALAETKERHLNFAVGAQERLETIRANGDAMQQTEYPIVVEVDEAGEPITENSEILSRIEEAIKNI